MTLRQLEYLIHGNILPMSINRYRMSERLVILKVLGEGYRDSTWGENVGHVKAYVGVESDGTPAFFEHAYKYLALFLNLYTLQKGQPYVVFRPLGTRIDDFDKLGVSSYGYPNHEPIISSGRPLESDVNRISKLKVLFQHVESDYERITDSPLGLSLQFFYDAVMSNHRGRLELAVVHFVMAAEALVVLGEESKRQKVGKGIGVLFSETQEEYESAYRKMKKLYGVRGGIVHGGGKKASPMDVGILYNYIRKAILERLSLRQLSKPELVEKLDQIAESWEKKAELKDLRQFDW